MIEVLDEIIEDEPRYRIRDKDGNIILDNVTIEFITRILQESTPLNKKLFASIKSGNDLVQKFNAPEVAQMWDDYNYFKLDNVITEYEKGMRVLIEPEQKYSHSFSSSIIPKFSNYDAQKGFSISTDYATDLLLAFDKDDDTYAVSGPGNGTIYLNFPMPIKPKKIRLKGRDTKYLSCNYLVKGTKMDGSTDILISHTTEILTTLGSKEAFDKEFEITTDEFYTNIYCYVNKASDFSGTAECYIYTLDITEGECAMINPSLNSYININNLGNKLINSLIIPGNKYELIYDGTTFNATEVS